MLANTLRNIATRIVGLCGCVRYSYEERKINMKETVTRKYIAYVVTDIGHTSEILIRIRVDLL